LYVNARHGVNAPFAKKKDLSGLDGELVNGRFRTSGRRDAQDLTLAAKKHGVAVHALCAMSNHYHLIGAETRSRGQRASSFMLEMEPCTRRDMTRSGPRNGVLRREPELTCVSMTSGIRLRAI
jgi:hypothetical protein